ncbi:MAG: fatty acid desaturase, partial [Gemmatimonadetes bacterium]|nr:fatty acid desaturase [Gemmatimonadota bacterium]
RRHHQHTDRPDDPHSPHVHGTSFLSLMRGLLHAHFGWFFSKAPTQDFMRRYVPDLQADRLVASISRLFPFWVALGLLIPAGVGYLVTESWVGAFMGLVWGGLLRVLLVHHITWSVNSVCHLWGQRPFNTHDESRNNPVFGVLALGEGWHNNHHAFPASAKQGLEWWQIDVSYLIIRLLSLVGLVRDIRIPPPERIAAKRRAA